MRHTTLALALTGLATLAPVGAGPAESFVPPTHDVPRADEEFTIDGVLDEPGWSRALRLELDFEVRPGENISPPVRTELFVTYNERLVLFAFRAHDPDPSRIRARYSDRDRAWNDDWVGIVIDTFNDQRRAYEMLSNPLGVQIDAINDEIGGNYDTAWDAIWYSAGQITEQGFDVELAIPFHQIRFQAVDGEQVWGFDAIRSYPRNDRHHIGLFPRDRSNNSYLSQTVKLVGMAGASPGKNLEFIPTLTASRQDDWDTGDDARSRDESAQIGGTVRWGITPNVSLNGAYNPDFSQVEADAVQLSINQQFALFFREKRPFFLESSDYFNTELNLVHTRTVADPSAAGKVTGKNGRHTFGVFAARDEVTDMIFPGPEGSSGQRFADIETTSSVGRYRFDFGNSSTIGGAVTDRRGGGYHNQVISGDSRYRITDADTLDIGFAWSDTEYADAMQEFLGDEAPVGSFSDTALSLNYNHSVRDWWTNLRYRDIGDDFRSDVGFRPQVGYTQWIAGGARVWWGDEGSFFNRIGLGGDVDRTQQQDGELIEEEIESWLNLNGPRESFTNLGFGRRNRRFEGVDFEDQVFARASFGFRPTGDWFLGFSASFSDWIDFTHVRPAERWIFRGDVSYNFGRHLLVQLVHTYQQLKVADGRLFRANVPEARVVHQFNTRAFVRAILQYTDVRRNVELYEDETDAKSEDFLAQLLFTYKVNPQTAVYLGYTDLYVGDQELDLSRTSRTLFLKLGYAWLP